MLTEAEIERDKSLKQVSENNKRWLDQALTVIWLLPSGWIGTGEDIRREINKTRLLVQPSHHNAWGALIGKAVRKKMIVPTGRYLKMTDKTSHARKTPEYRKP